MAETYDVKLYEAMIWYEHYRFFGNMGSVYAAKMEKLEDGSYKLFNRLIPSPELLEMNRGGAGQKLHTSIEILTAFQGRNKAYQYGLAITDSPASVGTDKLAFSAGMDFSKLSEDAQQCVGGICKSVQKDQVDNFKHRVPGVDPNDLEIFISQPLPDLEFSKERSFFDFGGLFGRKNNDTETEQGDNDMNKQETSELIDDKLQAFGKEFGKQLMEKLTEKFSTETAPEPTPPAKPDADDGDHTTSIASESFSKLQADVAELKDMKETVGKIFSALDNLPDGYARRSEA